MNLCFSSHVLLAGLFLSVSALTPEECQPMVTPLSLADLSVVLGRHNTMSGYSDNEAMHAILNMTDSSWFTFSAQADSTNGLVCDDFHKIAGNCMETIYKMTVDGNALTLSMTNWTSVFHLLPSSEGCIVYSGTSTIMNFDEHLKMFEINMSVGSEEIHIRDAYLICREETLKDSDLEHFKQQASCLGFSGEPNFRHHPDKGFCKQGEGLTVDLS